MSAPPAAVLRIATRKSQLALWQAEHVAALLRRAHEGLEIELVPMVTQGDRIQDRSLAAIGGKGLFIKELEVALEERRADIAVHSMKDLPGDLPEGLSYERPPVPDRIGPEVLFSQTCGYPLETIFAGQAFGSAPRPMP